MLRKALIAALTATLLATGSGSAVPEGKPACKPRYPSSSGLLLSTTAGETAVPTFTPGLPASGIVSGGSSSVSRRPVVSGGGGSNELTTLSSGDSTTPSGSASTQLSGSGYASGHASGPISGHPSATTRHPPVGHPVTPGNSTRVSGVAHVSGSVSGYPPGHASGSAHVSGHASGYPSVHASGSGHISGPISGYPSVTRHPVSGLPVASATGSASGAVSTAFLLQAQGTQETTVDGFYLTLVSNGDGTYHGEFKASIATAEKFVLHSDGSLATADGTLVAVVAYQGSELLDNQLFVPASALDTVSVADRRSRQAPVQYYEDVCVANANATLTCNLPVWPSGLFQVSQGAIILEIGSRNEGFELILYIVPAGSAAPTSTPSSTLRSTSSSMSSLASSASPTSCGPPGPTLLPVANTDIDRSSMSNLEPSMNTTLNYAEAYPGTQALSLYLTMTYKQVTLENSELISVTCSGDNLIVTATNNDTQQYIMSTWGSANLVLFTNTASCNNATSRGVYYVNGAFATAGTLDVTFVVASTDFGSVAEAIAIKYGSVNYPSAVSQAASSTAYTSTCSETGSPLPTASMTTDSSVQMDQNSINYYLALKAAIQYDSDGNIIGHPSNPTNLTVPVASFDPTNTTAQAALEQALEDMGLSPPSSLASEAAQALQSTESSSSSSSGTCSAAVSKKKRGPTPTVPGVGLRKRLTWDQFTDYACDDDVDDMLGIFGEDVENGVEAACGINDLAENGDSLKCLFSNCYTTTTIITYYTPPPATKYDFDYSWNVQFPPIEQDVVYDQGNTVSCVNCGFSISNLEFSGEIIINMTAGTIDEAKISADMSGVATMIAGIDSSDAWSGNWSYIYSTTTLDAITLDNAFKIVPTILYGIGINYETDSAVSTSGGAQFTLNNAQVSMDLLTSTITSKSNWQPSIVFTNPSFTTGANIQLTPYMRWAVELSVSIFGVTFLSPRITSETVVGLDSTYSFEATSSCPADRLGVTSYVSTTNSMSDGSSAAQSLYSAQTYGNTQCFDVPSNQPSPEEIVELAASGGAFCTSYINYNPATVYSWTTSTSTAPSSTFHSSTTTVTVTSTPTITLSPTEVITTWLGPYTEYATTVTADTTIATVYSMDSSLLKRGFVGKEPPLPALTAAPATGEQAIQRRAVATPAVAASWSASEISYACSQVATGKVTVTSTQGVTVTSGVSTDVLTITANANGPVQTVTSTQTSYVYGGVSITTVAATATSTPMSCPFQNEVPSCGCMVVKLHGASYMEGLQLRYNGFTSSPAAIPDDDYTGYIWYLSSRGWLTTLTWDYGASYPSFLGGYTHAPMEAMNYYSADISDQFFEPAVCTKDPSTMTLDCKLAGYGPMYAQPESVATSTLYDNPEEDDMFEDGMTMPKYIDAQVQIPYWTLGQNLTGYTPLTLSYEEIDCLCNAWIP